MTGLAALDLDTGGTPYGPAMNTQNDADVIACTLDGDDRSLQVTAWRTLLDPVPAPARVDPDHVRLELGEVGLPHLLDLLDVERRCCSHLTYTVDVGSWGVAVVVDGPGAIAWYDALAGTSRVGHGR